MIAIDLGVDRAEQALRLVRALGAHRYVAGRQHFVHVLAAESIADDDEDRVLADLRGWARATTDPARGIDVASRDERLWRKSSDAEVAALLEVFWMPGERSRIARDALQRRLDRHGLAPGAHVPFDESVEDQIHPLAVDAGWELLGLHELDPERHKGAIGAYGEELAFESARFEAETAIPPRLHLYELPAIGPRELLAGVDEHGALAQPFVVWADGDEPYLDYVLRGVRRAAKLE